MGNSIFVSCCVHYYYYCLEKVFDGPLSISLDSRRSFNFSIYAFHAYHNVPEFL